MTTSESPAWHQQPHLPAATRATGVDHHEPVAHTGEALSPEGAHSPQGPPEGKHSVGNEAKPHDRRATKKTKVRFAILQREALTTAERATMLALMTRVYDNITRETFLRDLDNKTHVIALRTAEGAWVGFSTARVTDERCGGRMVRVVFSGDTVMAPEYWGSKALQRGFLALVATEKLRHPLTPLYWFLLSKGYKTYLLLVRNFPHSFPRVGVVPPADERQLRDRMATILFGAAFDMHAELLRYSRTGTVKDRVKQGVAPITKELLRDDDIAFFVARNPAHAEGDELVCLARIDVALPLRFFYKRWRALTKPAKA